jgi:hypothetical protein
MFTGTVFGLILIPACLSSSQIGERFGAKPSTGDEQ